MFDDKKPWCPPCGDGVFPPNKPSYTMTEEMDKTAREMRATIDRLLRFEDRLKNDVDSLMKHLANDNVLFKNTFAESHKTFIEEIKNEVNKFEANVDTTIRLFQTDIESSYNSLSDSYVEKLNIAVEGMNTAIDNFTKTINSKYTEHMNACKEWQNNTHMTLNTKIATAENELRAEYDKCLDTINNAVLYMKTNLLASVSSTLEDMKNSGELENVVNEELEVHVKNDFYNVSNVTVLNDAIAYCKTYSKAFYVPYGKTLTINTTLDLTGIDVYIAGTVKMSHNGVGIIVGDTTTRTANIYIREVSAPNYVDGDIAVRVVGVKRARVTIDYAPTIQLYANGDTIGTGSIAYSTFHVLSCRKFMLYDEPNTGTAGWINENTFHVERVTEELSITGNTYQHNNNVFYKPCIEGANLILKNCRRNKFYDVRNENAKSINLDSNTWQNVILYNYHTEMIYNRGSNFTDNGRDNVVECSVWQNNKYIPIYTVTPKSVNKGMYSIADSAYFTVGDDNITPKATYKNIVDGIIIPAKYINRVRATTDTGTIRLRIALLDENGNEITSGGTYGGQTYTKPVFYYGVADSKLTVDENNMINPQTSAVAQTVDILNKGATSIKISVQSAEKLSAFKYMTLFVGCDERNAGHLEYLKYALMGG